MYEYDYGFSRYIPFPRLSKEAQIKQAIKARKKRKNRHGVK